MALIDPPIPQLGVTGTQPATDIRNALIDIRDEINGLLSADNMADRSVSTGMWPDPHWKVASASPDLMLGSGTPYGPGDTVSYTTATPLTVSMPSEWPDLREFSLNIIYSKAPRLTGGNDPSLTLRVFGVGSVDGEGFSSATIPFDATIPGIDGLRTEYKAGVYSPTAVGISSGRLILPKPNISGSDYSGSLAISFVANGGISIFSGFFTIHSVIFRYRDWYF